MSCSSLACHKYFHVTCAIQDNHLDLQPLHLVAKNKLACPKHIQQVRAAQTYMLESTTSDEESNATVEISDDDDFDPAVQQQQASSFSSKVEKLAQKAVSTFQQAPAPVKSKPPITSVAPIPVPPPKLNLQTPSVKKNPIQTTSSLGQASSDALPKISSFDRFNPAKNQSVASSSATVTKKRPFDAIQPEVASPPPPAHIQRSLSDLSSTIPKKSSFSVQKIGNDDVTKWIVAKMDTIRQLALEVSNMSPNVTGNLFVRSFLNMPDCTL